jgi:hypothetical protein
MILSRSLGTRRRASRDQDVGLLWKIHELNSNSGLMVRSRCPEIVAHLAAEAQNNGS